MTDEQLIARLRERAVQERIIQKNNEAVAAALMCQRLLFDQGIHSASNSFAVRLGLEHENCAKNDAKLANDWDTAADRIEALTEQLTAARQDAKEAEAYAEELEKRRDVASIWNEAVDEALDILDDEGWLGESRERIELLKKPLGGKDE